MGQSGIKRTKPANGFTLAEMLVTLVVFSLVMVVVTDGLQSSAAVWAKVESRMGQAEQIAISEQVLSGLFDRAYAVNTVPELSDLAPETNSGERFSFIHYSPPWPDEAGYVLIELRIENTETGKKLALVRRRLVLDQASGPGRISTRTSLLIDNVEHMEFSYMEQDRLTGSPIWKSDWSDPDVLPKLARLTIGHEGRNIELGFEMNNAMAPECLVGSAGFVCEARR